MPSTERSSIDLITIPRTVLSIAVGVVHTLERAVVGDQRVRTAQGNAWAAICADRERAHQRDEVRRLVAELSAGRSGAARSEAVRSGAARSGGATRPVVPAATSRRVR